jgi:hypothetical protein
MAWESTRPLTSHMGLPAGATLGPYQIVRALGLGGMGEVDRARDPPSRERFDVRS